MVRDRPYGRPVILTARRFLRVCHHIEHGENASEACRMELVSYKTLRRMVCRNPRYAERLREAEEQREHFLREYHIENIKKHAPRNLLASLWWMERRFPAEFALRSVVRNLNSNEAPIGDQVSEDQLRRYGQLMAEFQAERQAADKALPAPIEGSKE